MSEANFTVDPRPGDVLLFMGKGEIAKIIAWNSDSDYSHVAVVIDAENLIEASVGGVRILSLDAKRAVRDHYFYVDIWRSLASWPQPLSEQNADALIQIGQHFLNRPYPTTLLPELGIAVAARQKFATDPAIRFVMRFAMDLVVGTLTDKSDTIMCSELAYRMFTEGQFNPRNLLKPKIIVAPWSDKPFPEIDYFALWEEIREILPHALRPTFRAALSIAEPETDDALDADLGWLDTAAYARVPTDADLADAARRVAEAVEANAKASGLGAIEIPNPKMVTPGDLMASPSLKKVGRFLAG